MSDNTQVGQLALDLCCFARYIYVDPAVRRDSPYGAERDRRVSGSDLVHAVVGRLAT